MSKRISRFLYNYVFKRTSTFVLAMVVCAPFFERAYDHICEVIFETVNEGRLWMHIKHKYEDPINKIAYEHNSIKKTESTLKEIHVDDDKTD